MRSCDLEHIRSILSVSDLLAFTRFVTGHKLKDISLTLLQYDIVCVRIKRTLLVIANDSVAPSKQVSVLAGYTSEIPLNALDKIIISEKIAPLFEKIVMLIEPITLKYITTSYTIKFKSTNRMIIDYDTPAGIEVSKLKNDNLCNISITKDFHILAKAVVDTLSIHDEVVTGVSLHSNEYNLAENNNCIIENIDYTSKEALDWLLRAILFEYTSPKSISYIYIYVGDHTELETVWSFAMNIGFTIDSSYSQYEVTQ
jgi:hypothetical protein